MTKISFGKPDVTLNSFAWISRQLVMHKVHINEFAGSYQFVLIAGQIETGYGILRYCALDFKSIQRHISISEHVTEPVRSWIGVLHLLEVTGKLTALVEIFKIGCPIFARAESSAGTQTTLPVDLSREAREV